MSFGYNIYFSDRYNNRVISYSPDTGEHEVIVGEEEDSESPLKQPYGLAFSPSLGLLVADMYHHRICRIVNGNLERVETYDPNGHRDNCRFHQQNYPWCPAGLFPEKSGSLLVAYSDDNTIYRINERKLELLVGIPASRPYTIRGPRDEIPPDEVTDTPVFIPASLVAKEDGTIFFIERGWQSVKEFHPERGVHTIFPRRLQSHFEKIKIPPQNTSIEEYFPPYPMGLALYGENTLLLADYFHRCVFEIDLITKQMARVMISEHEENKGPAALHVRDQVLWVMDSGSKSLSGYEKVAEGSWRKIAPEFTIPTHPFTCDRVGGMGITTRTR